MNQSAHIKLGMPPISCQGSCARHSPGEASPSLAMPEKRKTAPAECFPACLTSCGCSKALPERKGAACPQTVYLRPETVPLAINQAGRNCAGMRHCLAKNNRARWGVVRAGDHTQRLKEPLAASADAYCVPDIPETCPMGRVRTAAGNKACVP